MRELRVSRDDVRLVLNHKDQSVTGKVYDVCEGPEEKRRAPGAWGRRLSEIISGEAPPSKLAELRRA